MQTRFENLWSLLTGQPVITDAPTDERAQAYAELRKAEDRGDTRSIGHARMRLAQATHDQLSAEVWG